MSLKYEPLTPPTGHHGLDARGGFDGQTFDSQTFDSQTSAGKTFSCQDLFLPRVAHTLSRQFGAHKTQIRQSSTHKTVKAHTRQSRPDSGLGFQAKVLKGFPFRSEAALTSTRLMVKRFSPLSPFCKNVSCVRETEILVEQPPQGVFVCDHAGLVISKLSLRGASVPKGSIDFLQNSFRCPPLLRVFAPPSPSFKYVSCVRETEILVEQQSPQKVFIRDHAGRVNVSRVVPGPPSPSPHVF